MKIIATKEPKNLVYIDESGIDNTEDYPYGYCQKGQRFYALKSGKKTQRISMIAALSERKIVAPLTFEPQLWINQRSKAEKYRAFSIALNKK